jgi:hypothetical protein
VKYKFIECPGDLQRELCANINEDVKYIISEICIHNQIYPKHKITLDYRKGASEAEIYAENKNGVTFVETIRKSSSYKYHLGFIRGYGRGLEAAGIERTTPKEL